MAQSRVLHGDCTEVIATSLADERFHAVVTDPPYNFEDGFMQNDWDDIGSPEEYQNWCQEWAEECKRVLKPGGHLIAFSGNRSHHRLMSGVEDAGYEIRDTITWHYGSGFPKGAPLKTWLEGEDAEKYGDWRGMLKPATEFAVLARKPFTGSSTHNQVEYGVGNLNVEACRIPIEGNDDGRYPANLVLDSAMEDLIDMQSGISVSTGGQEVRGFGSSEKYGDGDDRRYGNDPGFGDEGGASRFFYGSKAAKSERTHDGEVVNNHPTVKPVDLMEWLIKLVTDEGQRILDPFAGSGTTGVAAENVDRDSILIEREGGYVETIESRLAAQNTMSGNAAD